MARFDGMLDKVKTILEVHHPETPRKRVGKPRYGPLTLSVIKYDI